MKIMESKLQKDSSIEHEFCLILLLWQNFLYNYVKYCSIFKILDNFEQLTERGVEKILREFLAENILDEKH